MVNDTINEYFNKPQYIRLKIWSIKDQVLRDHIAQIRHILTVTSISDNASISEQEREAGISADTAVVVQITGSQVTYALATMDQLTEALKATTLGE